MVQKIAASMPFARFAPRNAVRVVYTGNPVRGEATALRAQAYSAPGPSASIRLLVFGGSQGARVLSEVVPAALGRLAAPLRARLRVTQQCRAEDMDAVSAAYRAAGISAEVAKFFDDLPRRMADSHLVIARSGASTLGELTVLGRPSILVPYPYAMDDHQSANAAILEKAGAAWVVPQDRFDAGALAAMLESILSEPEGLRAHAAAAAALGHPDAAARLADLVENLGAP
jgi:UDP-N-acetylglucosamine--N-acetylmuramyl-(pentapeptide) pyrophosphoryl-undecaprenol N-acetylglucosamine transferase